MIIATPSFSKSLVFSQNIFLPHVNEKLAFSIFSGLKRRVSEQLRFRDELVWTVGLNVNISPRGVDWTLPGISCYAKCRYKHQIQRQ